MRRARPVLTPPPPPIGAPGTSVRIRRAVRPVAVIAALALVIGASMVGTASAQDVEGTRARVQRITAELERLQAKASALDEEYLRTRLEKERIEQQVAEQRAALADAKARMDEARQQASSYVVTAYMNAGSKVAALGVGDPNAAINEKVLLETLHGDRQEVADHLRAAQLDLDEGAAELDASAKVLAEHEAKQRKVKDEIEASVAEQRRLLDGANAELRAAIAAEQERKDREAAAKAAAEAEARERAARERAAQAAARGTTTTAPRRGAAPATAPRAPRTPPPAAPAPSLPVAPVSGGAGAAIAAARSVLGVPYRWAGASPATGFDCSGLTMWAWAHAGKRLPHSSAAQYAATQRISLDQLQPGDLVFFNNPISHVGLYIGGGMMIHAPHTGDVVKIAPITRMGKVVRAGRVA